MATFTPVVFEHHQKDDGTYNVKIRVYHNKKIAYIATPYFLVRKQLKKDFTIKDEAVIDRLREITKKYRDELVRLGDRATLYTSKELAEYLEKLGGSDEGSIDFVKFCKTFLQRMRADDRARYADNIQTTLNALIDFFRRDHIAVTEITSKSLRGFESFLRAPRTVTRNGRDHTTVTLHLKPLTEVGIINYMTNIRTLFNAARTEFNDEDRHDIRIAHYPFSKYKIATVPESAKRNIAKKTIQQIRDFPDITYNGTHGTNRVALARDTFMLSFYLVGMNTVDLFNVDSYENGRLTYRRSKTKSRRKDQALISIKVEPEAEAIIEKYRDPSGERVFIFHKLYASAHGFNRAIQAGMKIINEQMKTPEKITHYYARHSWATIARNKCRLPVDDISMALNHSPKHKTTDIYIEKDWTIIDEANRKVLDYLKK